ncbi:MAG: hypothetical protein FJ276_10795 [Planctomycetes bacterium]|nr:hypothetical protein [Planctomycetota bacterium]
MMRRVTLVLLCASPFVCLEAQAGRGVELGHIELTLLDAHATGYGTFQSHNQKVVANRRGIFTSHIRTRNEAYSAQQWRLSWSRDGGKTFTTLYEATHATNPPALETDADDNLYLVRPDFADGNSYLYRFLSVNDYRDPAITTIPASMHGKFCLRLDPPRTQLYFLSANNTFAVVGTDGVRRRSLQLLQQGPHAALQYPQLDLDTDGTLYAAWTTQKHGVYLYWDIHCMKSRDGGATWETLTGQPLTGQPLTPPIVADDTGPTDRITLDDEFDVHTWLSSFMAKDGKLHFLYQAQTQPMARQHYVRYDIPTGKKDLDTQPRFGGQTISINRLDGFFAADRGKPGTPLYCVASDLTHSKQLACVVSRDNGGTWHDHARSTAESDVMYAIGGCRDLTRDGFILGTFTDAPSGGNSANVPVQFFRVPKSP